MKERMSQLSGSRVLERPRLQSLLDELLHGDRRVLAVWAAAGAGKSLLLDQWSEQARRLGWVVRRLGPAVDALPVVSSMGAREVIVIDDAHRRAGRSYGDLLAASERLPQCRVIIAGRFASVSATSYELRGILRELRDADLAFTPAETRELARSRGLTLSDAQLSTLTDRLVGWSAGIAMAIPHLARSADVDRALDRLLSDHRAMGELLIDDVLADCDASDRQLLLDAAIDTHVPLPLLRALTMRSDAASRMAAMARELMIVSVDGDTLTFSPAIFGVVRSEARRRDYERVADMHRVASEWFCRHGDLRRALHHTRESGDPALIDRFVDAHALDLVLTGETTDVLTLLDAGDHERPTLAALVSRLLIEVPYPDRIRASHLFRDAIRVAVELPDSPWHVVLAALLRFAPEDEIRRVPLPISGGRASRIRQQVLGIDLICAAAEAWEQERAGNPREGIRQLNDVCEAARSAGYEWLYLQAAELTVTMSVRAGDWDQARAVEDGMVDFANTAAPRTTLARVRASAAIVAAARRYQDGLPAEPDSLERVAAADRDGRTTGLGIPARMLALLFALDDPCSRDDAADELSVRLRRVGSRYPRLVAASLLRVTDALIRSRQPDAAWDLRDFAEQILGADTVELQNSAFQLATDRLAARLTLVGALSGRFRSGHPGAVVDGWLLLAEESSQRGDAAITSDHLSAALRASHRFRTVRPFLARRAIGARLLNREGRHDDWSMLVLSRSRPYLGREEEALIVNLTQRERQIVTDLPTHYGIAAIASRHHLSVNTVKTHLKSIYAKLDVNDRAAAVERARALGLL